MERLIPFESQAQLEAILKKYEARTQRKLFKITWFHWGLLESPDDTVVQKTMIFGAHGQVWFYEVYASFKISPLKTHLIFEADMLWLEQMLECGFKARGKGKPITTEGFEMVWFAPNGKVRHRYTGDVFENGFLECIVRHTERAAMKEWVLQVDKYQFKY